MGKYPKVKKGRQRNLPYVKILLVQETLLLLKYYY